MFDWSRIVEKVTMRESDAMLYNYEHWLATTIALYAIETQTTIYSREKSGFLNCDINEFLSKINTNIRKVYDAGQQKKIYISDTSLLVIDVEIEDNVSIIALSIDYDEIENFIKASEKYIEKTKRNTVSVLTSGMDGFYLTPIGTLNAPLVEDNYTQDVLSGFNFVVKDLKSSNPYGRLAIINGPPGTGKTYLIRGIINELVDSTVILVPPKMVAEIDGPSLLPLFISHKRRNNRSITIVIEDADACLAPRMNDNISSVSSLLNHTDGILGALLNLKIIATTNQNNIEFDEALTRAGRLSKHIEVGLLNKDKANSVYKRLVGEKYDGFKFEKQVRLADVYTKAKIHIDEEIKEFKEDPDFDLYFNRTTMRKMGF